MGTVREGQEVREGAGEPWVLALARVGPLLTCFLSDGRNVFEHATAVWPPKDRATPSLPVAVRAKLAAGRPTGLRLQLDTELDAWPWEAEIEGTLERVGVARYLARPPGPGRAPFALEPLGSSSSDDPFWLQAPLARCVEAAGLAQAQSKPLLALDGAVAPAEARAFRIALQLRWAVGSRLSVAANFAATECGLPRADWRLYGDATHTPPAAASGEQRRQVTSVSIDLLKSTDLLQHWGAERYAEAHAAFYQVSRDIVESHGGRIDDPQGDDGLMAYFGLSPTHANTALQAVRAAWLMSTGVAKLGFTARLGVATGRLAVSEAQPFGLEVHLAARLQRLAPPSGVVVSASTQRLLGPEVVCERLPDVFGLNGFEEPQAAYRVAQVLSPATGQAQRWVQSRFVGRQQELSQLMAAWHSACERRRVEYFCLMGEAGMGKSRLLHEFERQLRGAHQALHFIRVAGHADTQSSAFAAFALARTDAALADLPALAGLAERRALPLDASTSAYERQRQRGALIEAVVAEILALASQVPLCCVFDDAHWLDPSTVELVERLRVHDGPVPLLLLVSLRDPQGSAAGALQLGGATRLRGLETADALALIAALPSRVGLAGELTQRIAERAGGVPLFLEETVRMVERLGGDPNESAQGIPATLEDLLMSRLDALGPARALAQLAAVLGAEFPAELWDAVLAEPEPWIQQANQPLALQRLQESGLLSPPEPGEPRYRFRHALMRDAAYESLWLRDRKRLHASVARALGSAKVGPPGLQEARAHHLAAAGAFAEAVAAWSQAARQAASSAADREALALSQRALALLQDLPDTPENRQLALQLHLLQAARFVALEGYGAPSVESAYLRAAALCNTVQDSALRTRIDLGLEACYVMRGDLARARALAEAAVSQTPWEANLRLALQARWAYMNVAFHQGELAAALAMADQCLARYHPGLHQAGAVQDPAVMCLCYSAWGLFERGNAGEARLRVQRVLALAERLNHPFSLAVAHGFAASVAMFCGDSAQGLAHADQSLQLCTTNAFAAWRAHAQVMRGRLRAALGEPAAGLADMEIGYGLWVATGARITCATYLAMQAEVCLQMGQAARALEKLAQAWEIAQRHGERYHEAELLRLKGCALWQARQNATDAAAAEDVLYQALSTARNQGKLAFALRSATALAKVWQTGRQSEWAARLLREAIAAVPDHQDTQDSRDAQAVLQACLIQ